MPTEKQLADFGRKMLELTKECIRHGAFECDAEAMANEAVECGLIEWVAFDPDLHGGCVECQEELEPGDMIYWGL